MVSTASFLRPPLCESCPHETASFSGHAPTTLRPPRLPGHALLSAGAAKSRRRSGPGRPAGSSLRVEAVTASSVREVGMGTYDAAMQAAGDRLVVLDMYTKWCGPCKAIAPRVEALARDYPDVVFLRLDCNEENKPLAKSLGVRSVPTFKLLRRYSVLSEVVGAKYDALVAAMLANRVGAAPTGAGGAPLPWGQVVEVDKDSFFPALLQAQGSGKLVVLDMFTDWCGPCKRLDPKLAELASKHEDVLFLKLNCNHENKPLATSLGVGMVPTFKIFKGAIEPVDEVQGAKYDLLLEKLEQYR